MKTLLTGLLLLGMGVAARADGPPLKVCLVSGSAEYHSDDSLAAFRSFLEASYPARCTLLKARGESDLPGLEALDDCDVALFFTRRLTIDGDQLARVKKYVEAGRPIVAVRTASHGFQRWLEFDKLVLGGNYRGHYTNDVTVRTRPASGAEKHPVLAGVAPIASRGSLYKTSPLADDAKLLWLGTSPEGEEPAAWVREPRGGRVFYTSLGTPSDFENATFRRLLVNALFWAARRDAPPDPTPKAQPPLRPRPEGTIRLKLRTRVETFKGSGAWDEVAVTREVPAAETAIVICDMWDKHWCRGATERCEALARKMDPVLRAARARGVQVVHAPSECMPFYAGTPQRLRVALAPAYHERSNALTIADPPLPIDDSDGGCDTGDPMYLAWTRQSPLIEVGPLDGVSDDGAEIRRLFHQLGIRNVIMMGVHTNMCVLNRSFAIKQMTRQGFHCVLVRDLTDTMYNPARAPHVPHDQGTELVVQHIEKYWGPSITSADLVNGLPR
ncbi:MAG TPA: ThuA domain-containing protein [Isosphaeraceae bacterium]|jgi:type 1 glutamine amidotransferase/nicotinamidase-related amidase|nr:ThuA domain-containing protein [Isosphaeraceae bacterium]